MHGVVTEGSEDRFLKQFSNLYIVLNEHGEICDWRLTKTTAFDEIEDLLIDLRDRLPLNEQGIETIIYVSTIAVKIVKSIKAFSPTLM